MGIPCARSAGMLGGCTVLTTKFLQALLQARRLPMDPPGLRRLRFGLGSNAVVRRRPRAQPDRASRTAAVRAGGVTRLALRSGRAAGGSPRHIRAEPGSPALCSARVPVFPMRALIYSECSYPCHARAHVRARVQACIAVHVCVRARVRVLATFIAADRDAEPRDWQALGAVCGESAGFAAAGGTD